VNEFDRKYERIRDYLVIMADIDHGHPCSEEMQNAKINVMVAIKERLKELVDEI